VHWRLYVAGRDGELPAEVRQREERDADVWIWRRVLAVGLREAEEVARRFGGDSGKGAGAKSTKAEDEEDQGLRVRREVLVRRWVQIRDMLKDVKGRLDLGEELRDGG